ncbi:hypothetical protein RJ639_021842, partial [Escallonia herrerae]
VTLEATHHGPETNSPAMFVEIGSTEEYWKRQDAAQAIALLVWEGLGLGGGVAVGDWSRNNGENKVLLGLGGGHYVPRHMDIVLKYGIWVGHLISGYSLPMEDPGQSKARGDIEEVGGTWKQAIKVAFETTLAAFPRGEVLAHLDNKSIDLDIVDELLKINQSLESYIIRQRPNENTKKLADESFRRFQKRSFKSWQKNAIVSFLAE